MSIATATNGKPRKQLSDQLDRLDSILDAIAEGLPGAVADACREGARQAVKDTIIEVLTNPELRTLIAPVRSEPIPVEAAVSPTHPPKPPRSSPWSRLKARLTAARNAITEVATKAQDAVTTRCKAARNIFVTVSRAAGEALNWRRVLCVSLCVGLVVGVASLVVPQVVAATISAVSVTTTAVAVQTGSWLSRVVHRLGLMN